MDTAGIATLADLTTLAGEAERIEICRDGARTVWRRWGSGPILVLLHGGFGSWTHWVRNIRYFARSYSVLAPDIPGLGESDTPPVEGPDRIADTLAEDLAGIAPEGAGFHIAGFSFGGVVGGLLARRLASRTMRLVLVGASGLGLPRNVGRAPLVSWRRLETAEEIRAANRINLERQMIADPARIDDLAVHLQVENSRRARLRGARIAGTSLLRDSLTGAGLPLGGIWGACDATCLGHVAERGALIRALDPAACFVEIAGAGHWVAYEAPAVFNAALEQCLASHDGQASAPAG